MSDDGFTLDLSDVDSLGRGFDPLQAGWYKVTVSDWSESEVGPNAKQLEPGTPGTTYELNIDEAGYDTQKFGTNRKFWSNFWHDKSSMGFWKGFLEATGTFTPEELASPNLDLNEARERPLGAQLEVHARVRNDKQYGKSNQINGYRKPGSSTEEESADFLR